MKKDTIGYECVIQTLKTAGVLWRESRRFFRPFGLTEAQFNVLHVLGRHPEGISQRELSDLLVVDRSNVTLLLDRMEKKGWIVRSDVPGDRRVYRVMQSAKGAALWKKLLPEYHKVIDSVVEGMSRSDLECAHRVLTGIEGKAEDWESILKPGGKKG